ncbi:MAG: RNA methyltransferase [Bacteroidota bacterium]
MLSKNQQKFISSLALKKNREEQQCFVVEGVKPVDELLSSGWPVRSVAAVPEWLTAARKNRLEKSGVEFTEASAADLEKISQLKTANQVIAVAGIKPSSVPDLRSGFFIALDRINDPGNLGTIIRIADWFGLKGVICSPETADCFNSKVVQSTMGSLFRVPVIYQPLEELISQAASKNIPVYLADMDGTPLNEVKFGKTGILIMGSESHGVNDMLKSPQNKKITIPKAGNAESLNVAVAAGIICSRL